MTFPNEPAAAQPEPAKPIGQPKLERTNFELWVETTAILLVLVAPVIGYSILDRIWPWPIAYPFTYSCLLYMMNGTAVVVLIVFLIWRNGEPWSRFGLVRPRLLIDGVLACFLWIAVFFVDWRFGSIPSWAFADVLDPLPTRPTALPETTANYLLLTCACGAIGLSEELLFRGYLLPRFERLLGSTWKSLLATSVLFALAHLYFGVSDIFYIFGFGLFFGIGFCYLRRLWPLAIVHAGWDFLILSRNGM